MSGWMKILHGPKTKTKAQHGGANFVPPYCAAGQAFGLVKVRNFQYCALLTL